MKSNKPPKGGGGSDEAVKEGGAEGEAAAPNDDVEELLARVDVIARENDLLIEQQKVRENNQRRI